ncbi:flagellar basal body P-ring protein FlgI [Borrelia sp. BU AG58]|uniref:flagellar basal body P-ring protein FlgI n=1 Tax=Borrelia sp. BU AG58 TaxID=2887345 RepID=UPI001E50BD17|nr:flagellar basal body P-ring protein FlgI [Borrelia sp. BU AG58]UER67915.1 flagellar basal body P-ring protein FlgI [Borrelia sp. BU AG58]
MVKLVVFVVLSLKAVLISFSQEDRSFLKGSGESRIPSQPVGRIRLKEIAKIQPAHSSVLTGVGIVAGLTGKGDTLKRGKEGLVKILAQIGIKEEEIDLDDIRSRNIALVNVTLRISGNMAQGTNQSVYVASVLDSKDLTDGILLRTELKDKEGRVIAIAAGPITTHEKSRGAGFVAKGATVYESRNYSQYNIILKKESYTLVNEISEKLKQKDIKNNIRSGDIIEIETEEVRLLSEIEQIEIENSPVVLINETNKVIMAGENAKIGPLMFLVERSNDNSFNSKNNEKLKIEIQKMNLNEFISKNSDSLTIEELITIIKKSKKINKLHGELILEEQG